MSDLSFYNNKKVFITGHTGFKGSWMCKLLSMLGTEIKGYALEPSTDPALFKILQLDKHMDSHIGDIRCLDELKSSLCAFKPEIVIHMAAQPLVREGYLNPVYTYETNVMGTVNIMEAVRNCKSVRSVINVTTDKVYENREWCWGYRENERLNGYDPYSNSKSCSELVTSSYKNSYFSSSDIAVSTVRSGNVIGGGDFADGRIIPDCIRSAIDHISIKVRNPHSIRPYQHVLEPIAGYLLLAMYQLQDKRKYEGSYNLGPEESDSVTTAQLASMFCKHWGNISWIDASETNPVHESNFLKLDISHIRSKLAWKPFLNAETAVQKTVEWSKSYFDNQDMDKITQEQITEYLKMY